MVKNPLGTDDTKVVNAIAEFHAQPNLVNRIVDVLGSPFEVAMNAIPEKALRAINSGVRAGLEKCVQFSENFYDEKEVEKEFRAYFQRTKSPIDIFRFSPDDIRSLPVHFSKDVASKFDASNAALVGAEGAIMGAAASFLEFSGLGIPLLVGLISADVGMSMTLLARHASQLAVAYGYTPRLPENVPLVLAAMSPALLDEKNGIVSFKGWLNLELQYARSAMAEGGESAVKQALKNPKIISLIEKVAEKLGVQITTKETAMLIPLAGALLNGSINIMFQQAADNSINTFFAWKRLVDKYNDEDLINELVGKSIMEIKYKKMAA